MYLLQIFFYFLFFIFLFLFFLSLLNNFLYKVPQVWTFNSDLKIIKKAFLRYNLKWKNFIDLWSWTWKILRFVEKNFKAKATWYEIDLSNYLISKTLNKLFKFDANIINKNYLDANLEKSDFIYIYLFPVLMNKVEEKIFKDSKKWTIIFINAFKFVNHKPISILYRNKKEKIFIYKI